jgi:hypothetical protein
LAVTRPILFQIDAGDDPEFVPTSGYDDPEMLVFPGISFQGDSRTRLVLGIGPGTVDGAGGDDLPHFCIADMAASHTATGMPGIDHPVIPVQTIGPWIVPSPPPFVPSYPGQNKGHQYPTPPVLLHVFFGARYCFLCWVLGSGCLSIVNLLINRLSLSFQRNFDVCPYYYA